MSTIVHAIFLPRIVRGRDIYKDLSSYSFNAAEKTFLASEVAGISNFLSWDSKKCTVLTKACNRYRLPYTTVLNWMNKVKCNKPIVESRGRPKAMDAAASEKFVTTLLERRKAKDAMPVAQALVLMNEVISDTKRRQGKRGQDAISNVSLTTQKKLFKLHHVLKSKPQTLTGARLKACLCPRISY